MTRAVLVGVGAALVLVMLLTSLEYVELRRTELGEFMRDSAAEMQKPQVGHDYIIRYGDPVTYLGKWVRLNQMIVDPMLCIIVGVLIGLCTRRAIIASAIAVAPVVVLNSPPDRWAGLSIGICAVACWGIARATRYGLDRRFANPPRPA